MSSSEANAFAYIALFAWPFVAFWLYQSRSVPVATMWTILGAYMWLPKGTTVDAPLVPPMDKESLPNLAALLILSVVMHRRIRLFHGFGLPEILMLMYLVGPCVTAQLNGDTLVTGSLVLPGLTGGDAVSYAIGQFLALIPFLLGRQLLRSHGDLEQMLRIMAVAGLIYSLPILFEVRMSPQLHNWVYGYFPHSFLQQVRNGGFRPVVFMGHGLWVAFFAMMTLTASTALWRSRTRIRGFEPGAVTAYLAFVLLMCKSMGALVYGLVAVPLVRSGSWRTQFLAAKLLVLIALLYPTLRLTDQFPTTALTDMAASVSVERAESLKFRFDQETVLLDRARSRLLFGWGGWGRSRVFDERTGADVSVTDGRWIITLGQFGLWGFIAEFGLLTLSVYRACVAARTLTTSQQRISVAAIALILALNVVDLLPNATLTPWTWLMAGALLGWAEATREGEGRPADPSVRRRY